MTEVKLFFVPGATSETQETVYAKLAKFCNRPVPEENGRIYSITWVHDGDEWTATVGEQLHGIGRQSKRMRGKFIGPPIYVHDPALVLAIFPPKDPYMVVTNQEIVDNVGSEWANPFLISNPILVTYFKIK